MGTWRTHVAGVTFPNTDGSNRQEIIRALKIGDRVALRREFTNEYDRNAIAVVAEAGQVGYVPAAVADKLVRIGFETAATVLAVKGGTPQAPTMGVDINIETGRPQ
jgi:HIRAN domain